MDQARQLVRTLRGKWYGTYGMCRCPAHDDRTPSLSIRELDGLLRVRCHAGCSPRDVLHLLGARGLLEARRTYPVATTRAKSRPVEPATTAASRNLAVAIWADAIAPAHTLVERYLRARAVELPPAADAAIRFHPSLKHPCGKMLPAMVGAITDAQSRECIGIHRTFLDPASCDKASVTPNKMILGRKRGGVVRLVSDCAIEGRLAYAEGIETALAAVAGGWHCWSAIDAGNMASLPVWSWIDLTIFVDHDPAGIAAAQTLASRWQSAGGRATLILAPQSGEDWNDVARRLRNRQ